MQQDARGLSVTCASSQALRAFEQGLYWALSLDDPGINDLRHAVQRDPDFALAHSLLARQLWIHGFVDEGQQALLKAKALAPDCTPREAAAIEINQKALTGSPDALVQAISHIQDYPNDCFVLSHVLGPFGLLAFSGDKDWREKNVALIDQVRPGYSADDWWYNTSVAFLYAEVGRLREAEEYAQIAWEQKENGNTAHSLAHVHFETQALDDGLSFLDDWLNEYGAQSDMRHHLVWHQQLLRLQRHDRNLDLASVYHSELDAAVSDPMPLTTLCDNASLLWRRMLVGESVPVELGQDVLDYANRRFPSSGFVFADIHRAMAAAIAGTDCELDHSPDWLKGFATAFCAFRSGDYESAVSLLERNLSQTVLLGGSNAQREIIQDTLREARARLTEDE